MNKMKHFIENDYFLSFKLPFSEPEKKTRNETNRFFSSKESNRNHQNQKRKDSPYHNNNNEKSTFFLSFQKQREKNLFGQREEIRRELNV